MSVGTVFLIGAGSGHPGLLTLRALACLRRADVVLYDKSIPAAILEYAPTTATKTCVAGVAPDCGESVCEASPRPIHDAMIAAALEGRTVVRLKGGDPFIFGRGGEEALALHQAGVPFEIVPGITAAQSAAAFAGIPLTYQCQANAVAFVTGYEDPSNQKATPDWHALARFPGTLAIYMGMSRLEKIAAALVSGGKDPSTASAIIHRTSTGEQCTVVAPLAELSGAARAAGLTAPAIILIGDVVSLHHQLNWFEKLPLFGKRILVTRPRQQAGELGERLTELGGVPVLLPVVEIREPSDWSPVDRAIDRLSSYNWLVFTSANGVHAFLSRLLTRARDVRTLGHSKLAAIGPKTAEALRQYHLRADLVPEAFQSEHLAAALRSQVSSDDRVLLVRADRGRDLLRQELAAVSHVDQVAAYVQADAVHSESAALDQLRRGEIDFVTLTSSNIARAFFRSLDETCRARLQSRHTRLVSISPVTSADITRAGFLVAAEARQATAEGLVEALVDLCKR